MIELKDNFLSKYIHWVLRLVLAATFIMHGYPKLGYNLGMGFIGYLVGPFEVFGAIFLLIGAFSKDIITRLGGLMIAIIMLGAIFTIHFQDGWMMHATADSVPYIRGFEWQALILAVSLMFVFKGNKV